MKPLKLRKKDISQQGPLSALKRPKLKALLKISLWSLLVLVVSGGFVFTAVYSALIGGKELFHKGCFNFRYDLFPIKLTRHEPDKIVFAAIGDTAVYKEEYLSNVTQNINSLNTVCKDKQCDFMVLLGDNISNDGIRSTESPLIKKYHENVFEGLDLPMLVIPGNHDYRTNLYAQIAYSYKNKNWIMPNNEFLVRTDLADFFGVNGSCDIVSYMKLERRKFNDDKWNFVFSHYSLFSGGTHGDAPWHIRSYWENFLSDRTDFHVSGHNHLMEYITVPNQKTGYVVSGAGSEVNDPAVLTPKLTDSAGNIKFSHLQSGFTLFSVTKNEVELMMYSSSGQEIFRQIITRKSTG